MKYTIVWGDPATPFISQPYDSLEAAKQRLDALNLKFGGRHKLTIATVNTDGSFTPVADKPETA